MCFDTEMVSKGLKPDFLNDSYYEAYLRFFEGEAKTKSVSSILEEYIYSPDANLIGKAGREPRMATRFLAGLLHPIIHAGFGIEFGLPGVFAEGDDLRPIWLRTCMLMDICGVEFMIRPRADRSSSRWPERVGAITMV